MDRLHRGPHNGEITGFSGKSIDLIGSLPHITEKAFNRIGTPNISMHCLRKGIKGEEMFLIFTQTPNGFGIALLAFGLESVEIELGILFFLLLPDANQFRRDALPTTPKRKGKIKRRDVERIVEQKRHQDTPSCMIVNPSKQNAVRKSAEREDEERSGGFRRSWYEERKVLHRPQDSKDEACTQGTVPILELWPRKSTPSWFLPFQAL